jgi:hypothetical protein
VGIKNAPIADLAFFGRLADTFAMVKYWITLFLLVGSGARAQIVTGGGVIDEDLGGGGIQTRIQLKISNYVNYLRFRSLMCGFPSRVLSFDLVETYHNLSEGFTPSQLVCLDTEEGHRLFQTMIYDPAFIPEMMSRYSLTYDEVGNLILFYRRIGES